MDQIVALLLPLPVAIALVPLVLSPVLVLVILSAVALSLRTPGPVRHPLREPEAPEDACRLGCLHIEELADPTPSQRRAR